MHPFSRKAGGIILFARREHAPFISWLGNSDQHEISYHLLHCDIGPILFCSIYRPPSPGEIASIRALSADLEFHSRSSIATIVTGDLNVHHLRWLRYLNAITVESRALRTMCSDKGLRQFVNSPTRINHLLDLVLSELDEPLVKVTVLPEIADHNLVFTEINANLSTAPPLERMVWLYDSADWRGLRNFFANTDWSWLSALDSDTCAEELTSFILDSAKNYIEHFAKPISQSSHPWLNDSVKIATENKIRAYGTPAFVDECRRCSEVILREYNSYIVRTREKLRNLRKTS